MNRHGAGPQFTGARLSVVDGRGTIHPRCLRRIGVELAGTNDPDSVKSPVGWHG
jgi:hypothetical protein